MRTIAWRALGVGVLLGALVGLGGAAIADEPPRSGPPSKPGMMQDSGRTGMMRHGMMGREGAMGRHHHRRSCFDAAWQSEEWKRCEDRMGRQGRG